MILAVERQPVLLFFFGPKFQHHSSYRSSRAQYMLLCVYPSCDTQSVLEFFGQHLKNVLNGRGTHTLISESILAW